MGETPPVRVFISYAKEDERWLREVTTHLGGLRNKGLIAPFDDRQITVGDKWDGKIREKLEEADLVVLLVTKHFLDSAYIHAVELKEALRRDAEKRGWLLPLIVDHCYWEDEDFAQAQAYPRPGADGLVPLEDWPNCNVPLKEITKEIAAWAKRLNEQRAAEKAARQEEAQAARSAATGIDLVLYLARAHKKWETVDLTALAMPGAVDEDVRPSLAQLFVPQDCRRARPPQTVLRDWLREQGLDPNREEAQRDLLRSRWAQEERIPALDLLARDDARRLVLLGDPGSGKSSLARFVLLELLRPLAADEARSWRRALDGHLPFLVELRDLVARDAPGERCSIPAYLADMGSRLCFGFAVEAVEDQLKNRPSLLIVDGFDEIFDPARRRDVVEEIVGLEARYPGARVLVTSRIAGFEAAPFEHAGFAVATLDDLSPDQVKSFAEAWFGLAFSEDLGAAEQARDDLLDVVGRRPQLKSLAGNPLMLTIMATVARHKRLARSRVSLYRQALDLLCYGLDYRKGLKLPKDSALADLDPDDTLRMLRGIAWRMQEGEGLRANAIRTADLKGELVTFFDTDWRFDPPKARRAAAEMIDLLTQRAWIVTPRGPALFGFVHRTFLEYLCAFELNERFRAQALSLAELRDGYVLPHVDDDSWHEVIRLLVGQLPSAAAGSIIRALCPDQSAAAAQGQRLGLGWQCIAEVEPGSLRGMVATCEALMDALYSWLANCRYRFPAGMEHLVEALNAVAPGSWPVPCLVRRGLPSPSPNSQSTMVVVAVPLAKAIWRFEVGAREVLVEAAVTGPDPWRRGSALSSLVAWWSNDPSTKPLLLARAVEDSEATIRGIALKALVEHFLDAAETKPLLLARAVEEPELTLRWEAFLLLVTHFWDAAETTQLLERIAGGDPEDRMHRFATMFLARRDGDQSGERLLEKQLGAGLPGIDPSVSVNDE